MKRLRIKFVLGLMLLVLPIVGEAASSTSGKIDSLLRSAAIFESEEDYD